MALFRGKSKMEKLEAELTTLISRRERIAPKRSAAKAELDAAERGRLELLTESDADDPKAEAGTRARVQEARSALDALDAATLALDERIAALERSLAGEKETAQRNTVADEIEARAVAAQKAREVVLPALRVFGKAFGELKNVSFDARQIEESVTEFCGQLEAAAAAALSDARQQADTVRNGRAKIPDLRPEPEPAPLPAPAPTEKVFTVKAIKWTGDGNRPALPAVSIGKLLAAPAFVDLMLPPDLAAKALELGAAVPIDDERARSQRGTRPWSHPKLKFCIALDDGAAEQESADDETNNQPAIVGTHFEPIDRGKPYTVSVPRGTVQ